MKFMEFLKEQKRIIKESLEYPSSAHPSEEYYERYEAQENLIEEIIDEYQKHLSQREAEISIIKELASYGEKIWDETDFRHGYKKISSGLLNDARRVLKGLK